MIKSLIILVLAVVLAAGAFLSKPAQAEFKPFISQKFEQTQSGALGKLLADHEADSYAQSCTFHDRLLWMTVEKDGKTVYTGAFNHWFPSSDTPATK